VASSGLWVANLIDLKSVSRRHRLTKRLTLLVEEVIKYFEEMMRLRNQGIPIDFEKVAAAMATTLRQIPPEPKEG